MARKSRPQRLLLDLSAWARSSHPLVRPNWSAYLATDRLLCHPVFALELLHNAINPPGYQQLRNDIEDGFDWLWPDRETAEIALRLQERLATTAVVGQRVKTADILIAALAVQHGVSVLHYDSDYDEIAERGGEPFESVWIAARGSLEDIAEGTGNARRAYRKALGERLVQLQNDADLDVWPALIDWVDEQLRSRGIEPPRAPNIATGSTRRSRPGRPEAG